MAPKTSTTLQKVVRKNLSDDTRAVGHKTLRTVTRVPVGLRVLYSPCNPSSENKTRLKSDDNNEGVEKESPKVFGPGHHLGPTLLETPVGTRGGDTGRGAAAVGTITGLRGIE